MPKQRPPIETFLRSAGGRRELLEEMYRETHEAWKASEKPREKRQLGSALVQIVQAYERMEKIAGVVGRPRAGGGGEAFNEEEFEAMKAGLGTAAGDDDGDE